jgi:hypothetical protein
MRRIRWRRTGSTPIRYRQAGRSVRAEVLARRAAVRCLPECAAAVEAGLGEGARVHRLPGREITLVEVAGGPAAAALWGRLEELDARGCLRFATPLVRDSASGLHQILTDEITVRFQPGAATAAGLERLGREFGLSPVRPNEFLERQWLLRLERAFGLATLEAAEAVDGLPEVEFAAANWLTEAER